MPGKVGWAPKARAMHFFNLDLHIAVVADLQQIFRSLGHRVTSWSLSGHNWVFGRSADRVEIVNQKSWPNIDREPGRLSMTICGPRLTPACWYPWPTIAKMRTTRNSSPSESGGSSPAFVSIPRRPIRELWIAHSTFPDSPVASLCRICKASRRRFDRESCAKSRPD